MPRRPMKRLPAILALGVALALGGCGAFRFASPDRPVVVSTAYASSGASAISAYRRSRGLSPVKVDASLMQVAEHQARAMARTGEFSHNAGGAFYGRIRQFGTAHTAAAENLSLGARSVEEAMSDWKASAEHNKALLLPKATRIGLVRADAAGPGGQRYWALVISD